MHFVCDTGDCECCQSIELEWLQRTRIIQCLLIIFDIDQLAGSIKKTRDVSGSNGCQWMTLVLSTFNFKLRQDIM